MITFYKKFTSYFEKKVFALYFFMPKLREKKIAERALKEATRLQKDILSSYEKNYPDEPKKYYVN